MKRHLPWVLLCGLVLGACEDLLTTHLVEVPANAVLIPSESFIGSFRHHSGLRQREDLVVRDRQQWSATWKRLTADVSPVPPLPEVDFSKQMIVLSAMGARPSSGYAVTIEGVYRSEGQLYASVSETSPGADCVTAAVITHPIDAVLVPVSEAPVHFVRRSVVRSCS